MRRFFFLAPYAIAIIPTLCSAAAPRTFQELANLLVVMMNNAVIVLIVLGLVVYFYGISTNILKMKDEGGEKFRLYVLWGLLVLFVMVSIWGILQLLENSLFGSDALGGGGAVTNTGTGNTVNAPAFPF